MLNVYINNNGDRYFVGNTITKDAGKLWEHTIINAINAYNNGQVGANHCVFREGYTYTLHMEDVENNYPELFI